MLGITDAVSQGWSHLSRCLLVERRRRILLSRRSDGLAHHLYGEPGRRFGADKSGDRRSEVHWSATSEGREVSLQLEHAGRAVATGAEHGLYGRQQTVPVV